MNVIDSNTVNEFAIKKSRFICYLYYVENITEIENYLNTIRNKYKDCNHICYAYIINTSKKYNDDNEPNGTAGVPILNILEKNNLTNILAIVIRYFGGIKLGAGGLIRAYSSSIKEALLNVNMVSHITEIEIEISTNHDNIKLLNSISKDYNIISKNFSDIIKYVIKINEEDKNKFIDSLKNTNINFQIKKK